jgi:hypothetical protein
MEKLFALSNDELIELLTVIKASRFNSRRACYWPCTEHLLSSSVYRKIERAVERKLGSAVYFVFDELFTPTARDNFQSWHKDVEDAHFESPCWNVWLPLYGSSDAIAGLEFLDDEALTRKYDLVLGPGSPLLPVPLSGNQCLFLNALTMDSEVVASDGLRVRRPEVMRNHVYLLNSSTFHRSVAIDGLQLRFGIKFSTGPLTARTSKFELPDIAAYSFAHAYLRKTVHGFSEQDYKQQCFAAARFVHARLGDRFNQSELRDRVLFASLVTTMLDAVARDAPASAA